MQNYYGLDHKSGRLVHVHAHFQLILGSDLSKNYRLPVEQIYLGSCVQGELFRVPAHEFELAIFIIRMVLKHSSWDTILMRHGQLTVPEREELNYLTAQETLERMDSALRELKVLGRGLFDLCLRALEPDCPYRIRVQAGEKLKEALRPYARSPEGVDILRKLRRRLWEPILRRGLRYAPRSRIAHGGLLIAVVGGDGAGKTTLINELFAWLSAEFDVARMHMGKPIWSWMTIAIRGFLKIGAVLGLYRFEGDVYEQSLGPHGYPWFVRSVCTARDRYLTYIRARQFSTNGGVVLCDRYSLPGFLPTDGPQCEDAIALSGKGNRFHRFLARLEKSYYQRIGLPDLLIVLMVQPEVAVQRKVDETEASVRARSMEVWERDWRKLSASVVDADQPEAEIIAQVKALAWTHL